jgi:hypothetical protein
VPALVASGVGLRVAGLFAASFFFVDDIALCACSYEQIQTLLRVTVEWCRDHRFIVHPGKTEILIVGPNAGSLAALYGGRFVFHLVRGGGLPDFKIDVKIGSSARYLGAMFRSDLMWDDSIVKWRKKAGKYIGGIARTMAVVGNISRSCLLRGFTAHARSVEEWACPVWGRISSSVWTLMVKRDRREACRLLGDASFGVATVGVAILLGQLPLGLRVASRAAAYALRLDALFRVDPLFCAVAAELRQGSLRGLELSSLSRSVQSCMLLKLEWPSSLVFKKGTWKSKVRAAAQAELWRLAGDHPSLALLVAARPSKKWLNTWILNRPARGDHFSDVLIAILGGRWRLFADVRHDMSGARGDGVSINICDCDLCDASVEGAHAGDDATVLFRCPRLEEPRGRWLGAGFRACENIGPEVTKWWLTRVEYAMPSTLTLAAAIFGTGAPVSALVMERLQYDLTYAFVQAFGPFFADNANLVRHLGVPQQADDDEWMSDADDEGDEVGDAYDSDDDGDGYFNDRLGGPLSWV